MGNRLCDSRWPDPADNSAEQVTLPGFAGWTEGRIVSRKGEDYFLFLCRVFLSEVMMHLTKSTFGAGVQLASESNGSFALLMG